MGAAPELGWNGFQSEGAPPSCSLNPQPAQVRASVLTLFVQIFRCRSSTGTTRFSSILMHKHDTMNITSLVSLPLNKKRPPDALLKVSHVKIYEGVSKADSAKWTKPPPRNTVTMEIKMPLYLLPLQKIKN